MWVFLLFTQTCIIKLGFKYTFHRSSHICRQKTGISDECIIFAVKMVINSRMDIPYINIHTHAQEGDDGIIIADRKIICGGVHPWNLADKDVLNRIESLWEAEIGAVGEIGLDYAREIDRDLQKSVLEAQLDIAQQRYLPVIIHCVRAYNDLLQILRPFRLKAVIMHGFTGNKETASAIIEREYYISLGNFSLSHTKTLDALDFIPRDRIFLETDTADITIGEVYEKAAEVFGTGVDKLKETIYHNYKRIF